MIRHRRERIELLVSRLGEQLDLPVVYDFISDREKEENTPEDEVVILQYVQGVPFFADDRSYMAFDSINIELWTKEQDWTRLDELLQLLEDLGETPVIASSGYVSTVDLYCSVVNL